MKNRLRPWQKDILNYLGFRPATTKEIAKKADIRENVASEILRALARQRLVVQDNGPDGEETWRRLRIHTIQTTPT